MKKIRIILAGAILAGATLMGTSCEEIFDDQNSNGWNDPNDNEGPEHDIPGTIEDFQVSLDYSSLNPGSLGAFDADSKKVVANNNQAADLVLCWQNNYGYVITQPKSSLLSQLYEANNKSYNNTNTCTIQNLGQQNLSYYADKNTLYEMSVKSGSIPNLQGTNIVQVEPGDIIAFKTNKGTKGVAQISSLSKVTKKITLKGYVYYQ